MTSYNFNKQGPIQIVLYHIHIKTNHFFNFQHISTLHIDHHFNRKIFLSCFTGIQREAQDNPAGTSESGEGRRGDMLPTLETTY